MSGIIIDNALLFDSHIKEVCKKASQKLEALSCLISNSIIKSVSRLPFTIYTLFQNNEQLYSRMLLKTNSK